MAYDGDGIAAKPKRLPSRKSVYEVLAEAVDVESPNEVMIVDRGLLRWAMVMTRPDSEAEAPSHKRATLIAPLRRYRVDVPRGRRTTRRF